MSKFRHNYKPIENVSEYDNNKLQQIRDISTRCLQIENVNSYAKNNIIFFYNLLLQNGITDKQIVKDYRSYQSKVKDNGFVLPDNLINIINNPEKLNIRIICTTLMYFVHFYLEIYAILIKNNMYPNSKLLIFIKKALLEYTGLNENNLDLSTCDINHCFVNEILGLTLSEVTLPTRYTGFPMSPIRIPRINKENYILTFNDLQPELSNEEKEYLVSKGWNEDMNSETTKYFVSGAYNSQIDKNSYFYKLSQKYNHYILTGPSGSVDILFHAFGLADNFNIELFVLLCIAYLCNCYHHTIYEILLICKKYGLEYDSSMDEISFIETLINKYTTDNLLSKKGGGGGRSSNRRSKNRNKSSKKINNLNLLMRQKTI